MNDCKETDYSIPLGTILDGVRIDGFIGRGSFGEVYRAGFGRKFKKACALKLLSPKEGEITPELRTRFEAFLLHGDIKPSNIVIVGGRARLADYGSFLRIDPKDLFGHCRGTPFFVAPEVLKDKVMTIRSEIFSLGRTINALADDEARRILAPVIGKASADDPSERYGTMPELAEDVKDILREHKRLLKLQDKHHRLKTILWWCAAVTATVGIAAVICFAFRHYSLYDEEKKSNIQANSPAHYIRLVHHYYDNEKTRNYSKALDKCQKALKYESKLSTDERNYLRTVMNDCSLRGTHPKEAAPNRANR